MTCTYTDRTREKRFSAADVEKLERRLRQADVRNGSLTEELARLKSQTRQQTPASLPADSSDAPPQGDRPPDAVSEVSYLSISAAGERRPYLGSSSGVLLADLVRASVEATSANRSPLVDSGSVRTTAHSFISIERPPIATRRQDDLPLRALADRLVGAYLAHDHIAYPFLDPALLLSTVERFYSEPNYYIHEASAYDAFVFNMVLAVATLQVIKYDWQALPSAESHQLRATSELGPVLDCGSVEALQVLLLICQYRTGSSVKDNSASMWHTIGTFSCPLPAARSNNAQESLSECASSSVFTESPPIHLSTAATPTSKQRKGFGVKS